jgi:Methyltransferase domain/2-C-methyl-D-erythritol 4-phosphate cytidylyltransferase
MMINTQEVEMLRTDVIQKIIDRKKAQRYLEIGVNNGDNFFPIEIDQKVAVDPSFAFSTARQKEWETMNPYNAKAQYVTATSDDFFAKADSVAKFDVVFIDGLHTYAQSLQDALNSLERLNDNGVIVMHDCKPPHVAAAYPAASLQAAEDAQQDAATKVAGWDGIWCGDVWKTICHLRSQRQDLRVFVLDCDFGLGIVMKGKPENSLQLTTSQIDNMTYEEIFNSDGSLLNLKDENYLFEFLETI